MDTIEQAAANLGLAVKAAMADALKATPGNDVNDRIAQHFAVRAVLDQVEKEVAKATFPLEELKRLLEGWFDKFLTSTKQENAVCVAGTVHWNTRVTASLADPQAFMDFVIANNKFELLDRKANSTAVQDYVKANKANPPGVNLTAHRTIGVNKPGAKMRAKGNKP